MAEAKDAVGDEQVVDRAGGAHGDVVVAIADVAVLNDAVGADKIQSVGVGRSRVGVDGEVADGDVAAVLAQPAMMIGRVLEGDVVDEQAVAGIQVEHHGPDHVAVGAKRVPPGGALAVNRAAPADFQVMNLIATNEGLGVGRAAGINSQRQHLEHRAVIQPQIDAAVQCDRPAQIVPAGSSTMPPPAAFAASMAAWRLVVLSVAPSPMAP